VSGFVTVDKGTLSIPEFVDKSTTTFTPNTITMEWEGGCRTNGFVVGVLDVVTPGTHGFLLSNAVSFGEFTIFGWDNDIHLYRGNGDVTASLYFISKSLSA
jgi:hypothetical protein